MNFIREKVSGKRNRFINEDKNLDLSYITDNIIAMSFPASGLEKIYRNNIKSIKIFLDEKHKNHYKILNVSNRKYQKIEIIGKENVINFKWEDHKPPSFPILFNCIKEAHQYLKLNKNNVIIVNCLSGKGRTGSVICSLLLYEKIVNNINEAINLYYDKRGVTLNHPGQIRYVNYFYNVITDKEIKNRVLDNKMIRTIKIENIIFENFLKKIKYNEPLFLKIKLRHNIEETIYYKAFNLNQILEKDNIFKLNFSNLIVFKDFGIEIYKQSIWKEKKIILTFFNCDFINKNKIKLCIKEIDPYEIYKKNKANQNFNMEINIIIKDINIENIKNINNEYYFDSIKKFLT